MWLLVYRQSDSSVGITGTVKTISFYNLNMVNLNKKVQSDQISSSILPQTDGDTFAPGSGPSCLLPFKQFNLIGQTPRLQCPVSVRAVELSVRILYKLYSCLSDLLD